MSLGINTVRFSGQKLTWDTLSRASYDKPVKVTLDNQSEPYNVVSAIKNRELTGVNKPATPFVVWLQPVKTPTQGVVIQIEGDTEEKVLNRLNTIV